MKISVPLVYFQLNEIREMFFFPGRISGKVKTGAGVFWGRESWCSIMLA